jgi:hypothetical protein
MSLRIVPMQLFQTFLQRAIARLFGDNYYSPSATITNPHCNGVKPLRLGGPGKRSEPERRDWSRSDQSRSGGERSFPGPPRRPHAVLPATVQVRVQFWLCRAFLAVSMR